jgi:thiol-disulfide isomerase/thioredoxin
MEHTSESSGWDAGAQAGSDRTERDCRAGEGARAPYGIGGPAPSPARTPRRECANGRSRTPSLSGAIVASVGALALVACGGGGEQPQMSRTEGVKAAAAQSESPERWCDVFYTGDSAPALVLPKLVPARAGEPLPSVVADHWTWLNLWASWCVPCRREMPLLLRWHDQMGRDGAQVDLWFVSVDETQEDLTRFLAANPTVAPGSSVRLAAFSLLQPWLKRFPGAPTDTVPLQVIAAPGGRVRCVRAGSLVDADYPVVKALLAR